jgi:hypothetical protein
VFRALRREPSYSLPPDFAEKVLLATESTKGKSSLFDHLWLIAGILVLLSGFGVTVILLDLKIQLDIQWGFLKGLSDFKGILIFALLFVALLHFIDKQFIRSSTSGNGTKKAIPIF